MMSSELVEAESRLAGFLILDGGLASELERRGADLRHTLWSARLLAENPDLVRAVHEDYFRAGADVGISASYQASLEGFRRAGFGRDEARRLIARSVALVGEARDRFLASDASADRPRPRVAASIGCYGAFRADGSEYRGDYGLSVSQLTDWHGPRFDMLVAAGPDFLACETIPCLAEAEALVRLLESSPIPAWVSFACKNESQLHHGENLADAVRAVQDVPAVVAVGVNCTAPTFIDGLLGSLRGVATKPIVVYPNAGGTWDAQRKVWGPPASPFDWNAATRRWHALGARFIGGCCRTTPDDIRAIKATRDALDEAAAAQ